MNRKAEVYLHDRLAGYLTKTDEGYVFQYDTDYLSATEVETVSLTLPLTATPYRSGTLFPFFDGLIPEGWLLDIAERNWKLSHQDRFGLLLACCRDCIGAVSIVSTSAL